MRLLQCFRKQSRSKRPVIDVSEAIFYYSWSIITQESHLWWGLASAVLDGNGCAPLLRRGTCRHLSPTRLPVQREAAWKACDNQMRQRYRQRGMLHVAQGPIVANKLVTSRVHISMHSSNILTPSPLRRVIIPLTLPRRLDQSHPTHPPLNPASASCNKQTSWNCLTVLTCLPLPG